MNEPNRLHDEFEHSAADLPLASTGVDVIIGSAHRRTRRRRVTGAVGAVAVTAVAVVGIQQLSRVDDGAVPLDQPVGTVVPPEAIPTTTSVTALVPVSVAPDMRQQVEVPSAIAALPTSPVMTWTALDPDGPEAIALRYGDTGQRYALATEPGSQDDPYRRGLFEQRDGAWVEVASDVLPDGLAQATVSGDAIYAVGTAPATSDAAAGSVGVYDITSAEWSLMPLPDEARPYRSERVRTSSQMQIAPLADGALVAVTRHGAWVDPRALEPIGGDGYAAQPWWAGGALHVAQSCDTAAFEAGPDALDVRDMTEAERIAAERDFLADSCEVSTFTAAEIGLNADDVDALEAPAAAWLWRFDGTSLQSVELPDPDALSMHLDDGVLMTSNYGGQRAWFVGPDGSFEEAFEGLPQRDGGPAKSFDGQLVAGYGGYLFADSPGGPSSATDLRTVVFDDDTMRNPTLWANSVAAADGSTVAALSVQYESTETIGEVTTISGSGYDLVVDPEGAVTVVDQSTGAPIESGYRLVSAPGIVKLMEMPEVEFDPVTGTTVPFTVPAATTPDGSPTPETGSLLTEFAVDPETLPLWSQRHESLLASSVDGQSYAVESFAELVGADDGAWADIFRVDVVDGRFVVRGWVTEGDEGRSFILVGTPTT